MPAMLTRKALVENESGRIEVRLDNAGSCDNVTRLAEGEGWHVEARELPDGSSLLVLTK
jgi:TusA-related sulfurtransferase